MSFRINNNIAAMNALRNVGNNNDMFNKSIERLSTGYRINSAADDPAGLIISENFRAQIAGIGQAVRNSQDAVNYAKTAEGALSEVNTLLSTARSLAVAAANTGTLSASQIQADQTQLQSIASSITRISTQTQFGTKKLLDGSSGVNTSLTNSTVLSAITINGSLGGAAVSQNSSVNVQVTQVANQAVSLQTKVLAFATTALAAAATVSTPGNFTINGQTFTASPTQTYGQLIQDINNASGQTGVTATLVLNAANDVRVQLTSSAYGSSARIDVADAAGVIRTVPGATSANGQDAIATVTAPTAGVGGTSLSAVFTGGQNGNDGLTLGDGAGNSLRLTVAGNVVALTNAVAQLTVGSAQFQIGANSGQTTTLSLGNFAASQLGTGIASGVNLSNVDVSTAAGASQAIQVIDKAINDITTSRGQIGSFQANVLQSNIRSLGVAQENLSATESAIRDTDVAAEMTMFTKFQILQQAGISVLAQANQAPSAVLKLLQ